jgi:hypothetical protein
VKIHALQIQRGSPSQDTEGEVQSDELAYDAALVRRGSLTVWVTDRWDLRSPIYCSWSPHGRDLLETIESSFKMPTWTCCSIIQRTIRVIVSPIRLSLFFDGYCSIERVA